MSSAEPPQSASTFSVSRLPAIDRNDDITATDGMTSWLNHGFLWLTRGFALLTVLTLLWMGWVIFKQAQPAIKEFGFGFLTSQEWDIANVKFGALPYIFGTIVTSTIALVLALPIGLSVALVTSENFLPAWVRSSIAVLVELIAAIPSVIIGLWGIYLLVPSLQPLQLWLYAHFKQFPLFSTQPFGSGILAAGVILAIMILPTIAAISREVLRAIPSDLRAASMSLGATRWETIIGVILPASVSGILGAAMLGLGRALGETMAVTMVIGNSAQISPSLFNVGYTIPALLANEFGEALDPLHVGALMYLALILFALTLAINVMAILMVRVLGYGK